MNDILKEFKIVFGLDNAPLEKGIKQSENSLKNFGKLFGGLASAFASYNIFKSITTDFVAFNMQLKNSIDFVGVSVEKISALGGALKRFGGDENSAISSIQSLSKHLENAKHGGGALIDVAQKFGIAFNPFASADDTLLSIVKQMKNYTATQRVAIAQQLGLDKSLVVAFKDGGAELEKLIKKQKEYGVTTERDLQISKDFNDAFLDLKDIFSALMRDFSRVVLPSFTKLITLFSDFIAFLRNHKTIVLGFFAGLLVAMTPIILGFAKMAIASAAAFAPIYAVIAVVTAIAFVLEDIYYYFNGWGSVTGELVKKFPALAGALEVIRPIVMGIFETFGAILDLIQNPGWDSFGKIFTKLGETLKSAINTPLDLAIKLIEKLGERFKVLAPLLEPLKAIVVFIKDTFAYIFELISNFSFDGLISGFNSIKDSVSGFFDKINPFSKKEPELTPALQPTPQIPNNYNNSNSNTYNINQNINQNISSATPQALADSTNKAMVDSVNQMRQQRGALQ